jgi:hypothetical protein
MLKLFTDFELLGSIFNTFGYRSADFTICEADYLVTRIKKLFNEKLIEIVDGLVD